MSSQLQSRQLSQHTQAIKTQDSSFPRCSTIMPPSASELTKVIKSLQKMYSEQKQRRQNVQNQLQQIKIRAIKREGQMILIIDKLKQKSNAVIAEDAPEINKLFTKIWNTFDIFNHKTIQVLQQNYQESIECMNRKINLIMQQVQKQFAINSKNYNKNLEEIRNQVRLVCKAAMKIQETNIQMAQKVKALQFQLKVVTEQKFLILQDLVQRKAKIGTLNEQIKALKQQLTKITQIPFEQQPITISIKKQQKKQQNTQKQKQKQKFRLKKYDTINSQKQQQIKSTREKINERKPYSRHLTKNRSQLYQSILHNPGQFNYQAIGNLNKSNIKFSNKKNVGDIMGTTISGTPSSMSKPRSQSIPNMPSNQKNKNFSMFLTNKGRNSALINNTTTISPMSNIEQNTKNTTVKKQKQYQIICPKCKHNLSDYLLNMGINYSQDNKYKWRQKQQMYINTIHNLQANLHRQKSKNAALTQQLNSVHMKNQAFDQDFCEIVAQLRELAAKNTNTNNANQENSGNVQMKNISILEAEKFVNLVNNIRNRLSMLENPVVNCGWGDSINQL